MGFTVRLGERWNRAVFWMGNKLIDEKTSTSEEKPTGRNYSERKNKACNEKFERSN